MIVLCYTKTLSQVILAANKIQMFGCAQSDDTTKLSHKALSLQSIYVRLIYPPNLATFSHLKNFVPSQRLKRGLISLKQCDTIVTVPNVSYLLCFVNIVNAITKKLDFQLHQQYNENIFHVLNEFKRCFWSIKSGMKQTYAYTTFCDLQAADISVLNRVI